MSYYRDLLPALPLKWQHTHHFLQIFQSTGFTYISICQVILFLYSNIKILQSFGRFLYLIGTNATVICNYGILVVCLCQISTKFCVSFLVILASRAALPSLTNWAGSAFCAKKFVAAQHSAIDKINFSYALIHLKVDSQS